MNPPMKKASSLMCVHSTCLFASTDGFHFDIQPSILKRRLTKTTSDSTHTGQCKRTGGCYNELVVAFFSTGGGVKSKKIYTC